MACPHSMTGPERGSWTTDPETRYLHFIVPSLKPSVQRESFLRLGAGKGVQSFLRFVAVYGFAQPMIIEGEAIVDRLIIGLGRGFLIHEHSVDGHNSPGAVFAVVAVNENRSISIADLFEDLLHVVGRDFFSLDFGGADGDRNELDLLFRRQAEIQFIHHGPLFVGILSFLEIQDGPNPELYELGIGARTRPSPAVNLCVHLVEIAHVLARDGRRV